MIFLRDKDAFDPTKPTYLICHEPKRDCEAENPALNNHQTLFILEQKYHIFLE